MKFNKLMLISIFLLAVLAIGAVSASEDANETISNDEIMELSADANDGIDLSSSDQDVLEVDDEDKEDLNYNMDKITKVCNSEEGSLQISIFDEDVSGRLKVSVDDKAVYDEPAESEYQSVPYSDLVKNLKMGSHTLKVDFYNDTKYKDFSESWKFDYTYYVLDDIPATLMSEHDSVSICFSEGVKGKLTLKIDNGKEINLGVNPYFYDIPLAEGVKLGKHTYELKFTSSDTKKYKSFTKKGSYTVDYYFVVAAYQNDIFYGEDGELVIEIPWDATKKVSVTWNNQTKYYSMDYDDEGIHVTLTDLKFGENKITVTYPGDKNYAKKTKTVTINVHEVLNASSKIGFESGEGIYFRLPEDAKGNLIITVDNTTSSVPLADGIATFDLSTYGMGKHNLSVAYDGDDYIIDGMNKTFKIVPNFIYKTKVYGPDGINITISLPDDANGTFTVSNYNIRKSVDVVNGSGSIQLYGYEDFTQYEFDVAYANGNYDEFSKKIKVTTLQDTPDSLQVNVPEIIVIGDYYMEITIFPGSMAEGLVNVTFDGKPFSTCYLYDGYGGYVSYSALSDNLTIGNHTLGFEYAGDDYYNAFNRTYSFAVDFYRIGAPKEITSADSRIYVFSEDCDKFTCYVDGNKIKAKIYDDYDELNYVSFDLSKLAYGEHDVRIDYSGDDKNSSFTKEFKINVSYDLLDYGEYEKFIYGDSMELVEKFTADLNGTAIIIVGDRNYTVEVKGGLINTTIDNLPLVNNITVIYSGDNSTPAKSFSVPINVGYKIISPYYINRVDGDNITLKLPEDAAGALEVKIVDGNGNVLFNETQNLISGEANIFVRELKLGNYFINAKYTCDDYRVDDFDGPIHIIPKLTYKRVLLVDESSELLFELPSDANGTLAVSIEDKKLKVNFVNGTAKITVPGLRWFDDPWYYEISYRNDSKYGEYSSDVYEFNVYVEKRTPTVKVTPPKVIIQNNTFTVKFNLPSDATGEINIDGMSYATIKKGVGEVSVKVSKKGKVTLSYYYWGDDKYDECSGEFTINVLKAPTLTMKDVRVFYTNKATFKVKVVDTYGKIVKGKYVTFYVNGKKVKSVKTNNKGYATIKLSKNPGTYKVKAVYKGGVTTKKLTVKHLVSLKTATVKKSAKKLVLKVTLKKGKKALKYKKITFKFNGKKYTSWTNKKGVAKVTIKKAVLKKLKVGKTVKYQATYKKDTVKKSAKVKK